MGTSKGFTLIELMVVVAIVAILAAVAIPQYNGYVARTQLSEAIVMLGGLKIPIGEQFSHNDSAGACVLPPATVTSGKYVENIVAAPGNPCVITATMKDAGISDQVVSAVVKITYVAATGLWSCTTSAPAEVAPSGCPHE